MISIYEYTDFRKYMRDWLVTIKKTKPHYSLRYIANKTGFKSAGHLSLVLNGKVNLSLKYLDTFTTLLNLNKKEADYFQAMVLYTQSTNHDEKRRNFERMVSSRDFKCKEVDVSQYELFDKWYYVAVREILAIKPFSGNFKDLAKLVHPAITPSEAEKAVAVLLRLGMVHMTSDGYYKKNDAVLSSGYQTPTVAVSNFINETMNLAKDALYKTPRGERNISWATISVSEKTFKAIQEEVRLMRKRILQMAQTDESPERVYHFGFQVFPLSVPLHKEGQP